MRRGIMIHHVPPPRMQTKRPPWRLQKKPPAFGLSGSWAGPTRQKGKNIPNCPLDRGYGLSISTIGSQVLLLDCPSAPSHQILFEDCAARF